MPDDNQVNSTALAEPKDKNKQSGTDDGIPKSVKTAAAVVGIIVTLFGLLWQFYTFQQHFQEEATKQEQGRVEVQASKKQQAEQDLAKAQVQKEAAFLQLQDEQIKLDISNNQLNQHLADTALELDKHKLDLAREEKNRLSTLIGQIFDPKMITSEGTLALLSEYAASDSQYKTTILNTLAARLGDCKSQSEVRLIYRLLVQIGPESLETIIESNRNARKEVDAGLGNFFWQSILDQLKPEGNKSALVAIFMRVQREGGMGRPMREGREYGSYIESIVDEAFKQTTLLTIPIDSEYRTAAILRDIHLKPIYPLMPLDPSAEFIKKFYDDLEQIAARSLSSQITNNHLETFSTELTESVSALQELLSKAPLPLMNDALDLSECYLSHLNVRQARFYTVTLDQAYVHETVIGLLDHAMRHMDAFSQAITAYGSMDHPNGVSHFERLDGKYPNARVDELRLTK
jgi:hypothetical protein